MIELFIIPKAMASSSSNILPTQGEVRYHPDILSHQQCQHYLAQLQQHIPWQPDRLIMFGRHIVTKRQVAWYGDAGLSYRYAGSQKIARPWTHSLRELLQIVQQHQPGPYNSCLLNLYHHGQEGMGWHQDNEPEIIAQSPIASVSLGAARRMQFRHKSSQEVITLTLDPGSLLLMQGTCQQYWQHRIPIESQVREVRINLTFRCLKNPQR